MDGLSSSQRTFGTRYKYRYERGTQSVEAWARHIYLLSLSTEIRGKNTIFHFSPKEGISQMMSHEQFVYKQKSSGADSSSKQNVTARPRITHIGSGIHPYLASFSTCDQRSVKSTSIRRFIDSTEAFLTPRIMYFVSVYLCFLIYTHSFLWPAKMWQLVEAVAPSPG